MTFKFSVGDLVRPASFYYNEPWPPVGVIIENRPSTRGPLYAVHWLGYRIQSPNWGQPSWHAHQLDLIQKKE